MNYIVKSAGNGVSQKNITIEMTRKDYVLTIDGDVFVHDGKDGGLCYEVADWEIVALNGQECSHTGVWDSIETLYGDKFTTEFAADIDAAFIEVASEMVTAKTPQPTPEIATADFGSMTMEDRIKRVDWEAVKHAFEVDFDLRTALDVAIGEVDSEEFTEINIDAGYGSRNFTVEVEFDRNAFTREIVDSVADSVYEFCDEQMASTTAATAA